MNSIRIDLLKATGNLPNSLYHKSGEMLLKRGDALDLTTISLLRRLGVEKLFFSNNVEDLKNFVFNASYRAFPVEKLPDGLKLSKPLTDLEGKDILGAGETLTRESKARLKKNGVNKVFIPKSKTERKLEPVLMFKKARALLDEMRRKKLSIEESQVDPSETSMTDLLKSASYDVAPDGEALKESLAAGPRTDDRTEQEKDLVSELKSSSVGDLVEIFKSFQDTSNRIKDPSRVVDMSRSFIEALIRDRELLLNSINLRTDPNLDYLVKHPVDVTVLSINTATALGYTPKQIMEIAFSAFLLDLGMFKVPKTIRQKPGKLTTSEYLEIQKHSSYSLDFLQKMRRLPSITPVVVYQVHERDDKSGYPKSRPGNLIHRYAKIISVADVYSALITNRPYRKALSPYRAMRAIVELGARKKLDSSVVRAFLQFVCLFPVGSWVKLNTGETGKVIAANENDYTKPVVRVLFGPNGDSANRVIDLMREDKIGIVDGLNWDEEKLLADMAGF